MNRWIGHFVSYCVRENYVTQEDAPLLKYGIEKQFTMILISIPFLIFGAYLSSPCVSIAFYSGFSFLRCRANGLHAKTVIGCFTASLVFEYLFLGVLYWHISPQSLVFLLFASSIGIYFLAPYNHPNMGLSSDEISTCAKHAKIRLFQTLFFICVLFIIGLSNVAKGLCLSVVMTSLMLVLAYAARAGQGFSRAGVLRRSVRFSAELLG